MVFLKDFLLSVFLGHLSCSDKVSFPGGVLWYFHAFIGSGYFWGLKIVNFNIFGGFQKNKYFGYEYFVDIFSGVIT